MNLLRFCLALSSLASPAVGVPPVTLPQLACRAAQVRTFASQPFLLKEHRDSKEMAAQLRKSPGRARTTEFLEDSETLLKGTHRNAALIPRSLAEKLDGRDYKSFNDFRKKFWQTVADSHYANEFSEAERAQMKQGNAPEAEQEQHYGIRKRYELHHRVPISRGGGVYDLSNLIIASPRYHVKVFHSWRLRE